MNAMGALISMDLIIVLSFRNVERQGKLLLLRLLEVFISCIGERKDQFMTY